MKRLLGIVLLVGLAAGLAYGLVVTRQEASYRHFVDQGDAALARDDSFAAIEAFSVAISLKPESMAPHLKRGEAYRRRGEFDAALRDLRRAAELDPLAVYPRELLGDVHYAVAAASGASAQPAFSAAVDRYRESVGLDDRSARLQYKLGLASYRAGAVDAALGALRLAIQLEPRFAEAHYVLGLCLREKRQVGEALGVLERSVMLSSTLVAAHEELADIYGELRRHDARLTHLEALARLQPGSTRERALAFGLARAGHLDRALAQLAQAAQRYPTDAGTYVALGRLWLERTASGGRVELGKALEALQGAVGSDSSSEALTLMGRALLLSGDPGRAEQTLHQATRRFPVDPEAFRFLSDAAERRGHGATAQRALLDYAALVPLESMGSSLLARVGEAHLQIGHLETARRIIDAALAKDPANAHAQGLRRRLE